MTRDEVKDMILWAVDHWQKKYHRNLMPGNLVNYVSTWTYSHGYNNKELLEILREMTNEPNLQEEYEDMRSF